MFDEALLSLQAEDYKIHVLRQILCSLIRSILTKFVKPSAMLYKSLKDVQYKKLCNQNDDNELVIGEAARYFHKNKTENRLRLGITQRRL